MSAPNYSALADAFLAAPFGWSFEDDEFRPCDGAARACEAAGMRFTHAAPPYWLAPDGSRHCAGRPRRDGDGPHFEGDEP